MRERGRETAGGGGEMRRREKMGVAPGKGRAEQVGVRKRGRVRGGSDRFNPCTRATRAPPLRQKRKPGRRVPGGGSRPQSDRLIRFPPRTRPLLT